MTPMTELTKREQEVIEQVLAGKSNKEIASTLFVSERTVEFHLQNIYNKLDVKSRVELVLKLGVSTVADAAEIADNRSKRGSPAWVASLQAAVSRISKELKMESLSSIPAPATDRTLTFFEAIRICFAKYAEFDGRASRAEFWWFALFITLVASALTYVHEVLGSIFLIAVMLPFLAVGARRLRDIGKSAWWELLLLAPVGGLVMLGILWAMPPVAALSDEAPTI